MNAQKQGAASRCLSPNDAAPVIVHNSGAGAPILLICDHAGRGIPERLGDLGLRPAERARHIAWDIGAGALAGKLADLLGAELILQVYSRLVADCNRDPNDPNVAPEVSDGVPIAANQGLAAEALAARIAEIHAPYHAAIGAALDLRGPDTLVVSVHSFTPVMQGFQRPWHVGVLHSHDSPASTRMLTALGAVEGLVVGDNQPYAMDGVDYTIPRHAKRRGLDYLELEVRQDLIEAEPGQDAMASMLAPLLRSAVG